jgi:hypothetical protein
MLVPLLGGMAGWVTGGGKDMRDKGGLAILYKNVRGHVGGRRVQAGKQGTGAVCTVKNRWNHAWGLAGIQLLIRRRGSVGSLDGCWASGSCTVASSLDT